MDENPQPPKPFELEVSYGAQLGCAFTGATALGLFLLYALVRMMTYSPPPDVAATQMPWPIALAPFALLALLFIGISLNLLSERRHTPRRIDATGVTLRDGAHHRWADLRVVRAITEYHRRTLKRYEIGVELIFSSGTAIVRYDRLVNPADAMWLGEELKSNRNPFTGLAAVAGKAPGGP